MKIPVTQFNGLMSRYVLDVLAKEAISPLVKFSLGVVSASGLSIEMVAPKEMLSKVGVFDECGMVDLDRLLILLRGGFSACDKLQIGVLRFGIEDAERFVQWVSSNANN